MTSYQKLKQRISELESEKEKLKEDLRILVLDEQSFDAEKIRISIKFQDKFEKSLMYGDLRIEERILEGVLNRLKKCVE